MFKVGFIYPGYENLGIEYLSAQLKRNGFEAKLFFDPILFAESGFINNKLLANLFSFRKYLLREIINYRPDLLCFSVITDNYKWAREWAREIKEHISVPVVFGGIHPTSVPERVIDNPSVDYVCIGEGDEAIVDLAEALAHEKPAGAISNIWSKMNGKVIKNRVRPLITNLDYFPLLDKDLFYSAAPVFKSGYIISTSRGCPYSCSYCCNNVWRKIYAEERKIFRKRSIENVIKELKVARSKYKPRYIYFLDEVFIVDREWLKDFLYKYKKEIGLPFFCFIYPDLITEDMVLDLKKAGCYKIQMGVQVVDENKRRTVLRRNSSNKAIAHAIDLFKRAKIYVVCDTIFGFPDENSEDLEKIAYFYDRYLPNHIEIFWLRYYPKAEIISWAFKNGYINQEKIEEIEDGRLSCGIARGGDNISNYSKKFMVLFYLFHFLPHKCRVYILKKGLYKFFPSHFSPSTLYILGRIFNHAKYDLNISRTIKRYVYFILRKFITLEKY